MTYSVKMLVSDHSTFHLFCDYIPICNNFALHPLLSESTI